MDITQILNLIPSAIITIIAGYLLFKLKSSFDEKKALRDQFIIQTEKIKQLELKTENTAEELFYLTGEVANDRTMYNQQLGVLKDSIIQSIDLTVQKKVESCKTDILRDINRIENIIEGIRNK